MVVTYHMRSQSVGRATHTKLSGMAGVADQQELERNSREALAALRLIQSKQHFIVQSTVNKLGCCVQLCYISGISSQTLLAPQLRAHWFITSPVTLLHGAAAAAYSSIRSACKLSSVRART